MSMTTISELRRVIEVVEVVDIILEYSSQYFVKDIICSIDAMYSINVTSTIEGIVDLDTSRCLWPDSIDIKLLKCILSSYEIHEMIYLSRFGPARSRSAYFGFLTPFGDYRSWIIINDGEKNKLLPYETIFNVTKIYNNYDEVIIVSSDNIQFQYLLCGNKLKNDVWDIDNIKSVRTTKRNTYVITSDGKLTSRLKRIYLGSVKYIVYGLTTVVVAYQDGKFSMHGYNRICHIPEEIKLKMESVGVKKLVVSSDIYAAHLNDDTLLIWDYERSLLSRRSVESMGVYYSSFKYAPIDWGYIGIGFDIRFHNGTHVIEYLRNNYLFVE